MKSALKHPAKKELRTFGFMTGGLTPLFFGLLLPWFFDRDFPLWPRVVSAVLLAWAFTLPAPLKPVYQVWMTLGLILGWINTRVILSLMFYLVILPVGLIRRLAGNDPMARSHLKTQQSYRVSSAVPPKKHVERPF